ncbi:MAG: amidase [Acidobacteria bacterium]|nr:amidase [Acidobacteriota bacterium]
MPDDLCYASASDLSRLIRARQVSVAEVVDAHLERIHRLNPTVNAVCTLVAERARDEARAADKALASGVEPGPLFGLPIGIKDLVLTKDIRTTFGSRIYKDFIPDRDALHVERLKRAGAIIIGKTNTPEFGAGSQTFNDVFGDTRNPYDLTKTCGGSSGGGASALACGMVALADGSDLGGSLRNPPSFCNVVGLRDAVGRVPDWPTKTPRQALSVLGPMARTAADAALLLSVMAGPDARDPRSLPEPGSEFARPLSRDFNGTRLAWTPDLGRYPVDPIVVEICRRSCRSFTDLGCSVQEAHPDVAGADDIFQVLRGWLFASQHRAELARYRDLMKDTVVWNIEQGLAQDAESLARAEREHQGLAARAASFMQQFEFLVLPVSQVPPFPIEQRWVTSINGVPMHTYIDWMATCYAITLTGLPAISVPCGFTPGGLPIGLQIVGRPRSEFSVLQLAHAFEQATRVGSIRPELKDVRTFRSTRGGL